MKKILLAALLYLGINISKIKNQLKKIMTKQERFDAMQERLFTVTNNIAEDYKTLAAEAKKGTVSDESLQKAEDNIAMLESIGASVDNPVPGGEPDPAADA